MPKWLDVEVGKPVELPLSSAGIERCHAFDRASIDAVNAAIAARRPLLVRGEPGTGKSQLAFAAAAALKRPCRVQIVDSQTSAQEFLWSFDAVKRLAEAQLIGVLGRQGDALGEALVRERLREEHFVAPGPLWWALSWETARKRSDASGLGIPAVPPGWKPGDGAVLLIDEIDKADSDVPNGLLDVLAEARFRPPGFPEEISAVGEPPLVIITTNEERSLPDAFLRRCLVLQLRLPEERRELEDLLVERGTAHFRDVDRAVLEKAARQLATDRADAKACGLPPPGQAEYLDLVRAVMNRCESTEERLALLDDIKEYVLQKHPQETVQ